jgi:asparagine synthase (glutamine-hydrolysing)
LWRPKEAFSDGCSQPEESWYSIIQDFVEGLVTDEEFAAADFEHGVPQTKEQFFYRRLFEEMYPGRAEAIPHYWLPKWCGDDVVDPSARVLTDVYRPSTETLAGHREDWVSGEGKKPRKLTG